MVEMAGRRAGNRERTAGDAHALCRRHAEILPVGKEVGSVKNNGAQLLIPIEDKSGFAQASSNEHRKRSIIP
jgi:hypothetical protein